MLRKRMRRWDGALSRKGLYLLRTGRSYRALPLHPRYEQNASFVHPKTQLATSTQTMTNASYALTSFPCGRTRTTHIEEW